MARLHCEQVAEVEAPNVETPTAEQQEAKEARGVLHMVVTCTWLCLCKRRLSDLTPAAWASRGEAYDIQAPSEDPKEGDWGAFHVDVR